MEETREDRIGSVLAWLQSGARGKASRMQFKKLQDQKLALYACQRAIRNYMTAKTRYRLYMMDLLDRKMSFHLLSSLVALLSRKSLTKPLVLKDRQLKYRLS